MNIINKFAESLAMPVVNLNIYWASLCLGSRKPVTDSRVRCEGFHYMVWFKERIRMKSDRVLWPKGVRRLHFKWFIAEKPGLHFAADGDKLSIKPSKMRQSLMSSGLESRRLENTWFGLIAFCLTSLACKAGHWAIMLVSSSSVR